MSNPAEAICDALVVFSNDQTDLAYQFTATKPADPNTELDEESDNLRVMFWPHGRLENKRIGREGQVQETFQTAMLVIRKIAEGYSRVQLGDFERELLLRIRAGGKMAGWTYSTSETTGIDLDRLKKNEFASATILHYTGIAC